MTAPNADQLDSARSGRPLVLVVDDDPLYIQLINMALKEQCELLTSRNGLDALRLMKEHLPDLVLLDVMMPEIDGLAVFRKARADAALADIPIIFMTAMTSTASQTAALLLSAADYLIKPINVAHLRLRVRNQLDLRRQRDELQALTRELASTKAELALALEHVRTLESTPANPAPKTRRSGRGHPRG